VSDKTTFLTRRKGLIARSDPIVFMRCFFIEIDWNEFAQFHDIFFGLVVWYNAISILLPTGKRGGP
jgi:hypothetical protein